MRKAEKKVEKSFPPLEELHLLPQGEVLKTQFIREVIEEKKVIEQDTKETILAKFNKAFGG